MVTFEMPRFCLIEQNDSTENNLKIGLNTCLKAVSLVKLKY